MKNSNYLIYIFLMSLFLFSCSLEGDNPEIITDPPTYNYLTLWKETELKVGATDWQTISQGDTLSLFSDLDESIKPRSGAYVYKPTNLQINVNASGFFLQENDLLSFFPSYQTDIADRITAQYEVNSNILIITNTSVTPNIEVKYIRLN